jgi:hypothetical protein
MDNLHLSPAARRAVAAIAALGVSTGSCDASNEEIAHRAGLGLLTLRLAVVELDLRGVIRVLFVPGRGRSIALTATQEVAA